jgi:predicted lipoprotein with Yx(FWY)xxD motif
MAPLASRVAAIASLTAVVVAACSGSSATRVPTTAASAAPSAHASASAAAPSASAGASAAPSSSAGAGTSAAPSEGLGIPVADAHAGLTVVTVAGTTGKVLADENGMVLYTDKADPSDTSGCVGECAKTWPPFVITDGEKVATTGTIPGKISSVIRPDGTSQVTYDGSPLYFYYEDPKPDISKGVGIDPDFALAHP